MENQDIDKIIAECKAKTKIVYSNKGGFFSPRLRSINHLEVGQSKIISNPFTIFLELLYLFYKRQRTRYERLMLRLFPRHEKIVGTVKDSYLTGKLTFKSKYEPRTPIVHMKISLWARSRLFQWRKLAEGYSDENGGFNLPFDLRAAVRFSNRKNLIFEVEEIDIIAFDANKKGHRKYKIFHKQKFPKSDLIGMGYNLREIQLDYWNYRTDTTIPRTLLKFEGGDKIQNYTQGREDALYEQIIPIELTKLKHLFQLKRRPEKISYASIQEDYPENLTQCIEKVLPGYTRGDEWFGERMMNGMNCGTFISDPKEPGVYVMKYFGICNYKHNTDYALPDVKMYYRLNQKGIAIPFKIVTVGALNAINKDQWQERTFTQADGEMLWNAAKRLARSVGNVCVEVDQHFVGTHLNVEQYALATYRNFQKSPLAVLLLPHMREVSLINEGADKLIINGFLTKGTAMTAEGLVKRAKDVMGLLDWKNWEPMANISDDHHYAQAENKFWAIVNEYVETFFAQHLDQIIAHWDEVYRFSKDLVEHSVPVFLSGDAAQHLNEKELAQSKERFDYYAYQFAFDASLPRETINNELKTVSPITHKKSITKADVEDLENIKSACKYAIMQATFMHTWINEHQYDDLGEVLYSCGGLRFGNQESGVLAPEDDLNIAPSLKIATQQLWFANFLSRTEYGFITKNEDGDVNPLFTELLEKQREAFAKIGVDIDDIESRTNI